MYIDVVQNNKCGNDCALFENMNKCEAYPDPHEIELAFTRKIQLFAKPVE